LEKILYISGDCFTWG